MSYKLNDQIVLYPDSHKFINYSCLFFIPSFIPVSWQIHFLGIYIDYLNSNTKLS